jgi:hypothetical protein
VIDDRRCKTNSSLSRWTLEDVCGFNALEVVPMQGTKAYMGRRGRAPLIQTSALEADD